VSGFERTQGIGGSDVAALLGLSKWRSPWDVYMDKTGSPEVREESPEMRFGHLFEPVLADVYEEEHPGSRVERMGGAHDEPIWHPSGVLYAHIDGRVLYGSTSPDEEPPDIIWEGKTARNDRDWQSGVPEYYKAQVYAYLACTGADRCDVTVFFRDTARFEHFTIEKDEALQDGLVEAVVDWWNRHVVAGVPPDIDGSAGASRYLSERFPKETTDDLLTYDQTFEAAVYALLTVREKVDMFKANEDRLVNTLKSLMGEYPRAEGRDWTVTWKRVKGRTVIDWEAVAGGYRGLLYQVRQALEAGRTEEAKHLLTHNDPDAIVGAYTRQTDGTRPFVVRPVKARES